MGLYVRYSTNTRCATSASGFSFYLRRRRTNTSAPSKEQPETKQRIVGGSGTATIVGAAGIARPLSTVCSVAAVPQLIVINNIAAIVDAIFLNIYSPHLSRCNYSKF
jgi:hypothetical protein